MLSFKKIQSSPIFRLIGINLISLCVLAGAFVIVIQTFGQLRGLLEDQVEYNVRRAAKSFELGNNFIGVEVEVHNLLSRSQNDPEELIRRRHMILAKLDALILDAGTSDSFFNYDEGQERKVLTEYRDIMEKVLEETIFIGERFLFLDMQNRDFITILTVLEEDIGEFILKAALAGNNLTHLHQITALLPFCREQVLKVRFILEKTVSTLDPLQLNHPNEADLLQGAFDHMAVLQQTLETITATEPVFSDSVKDIISNIGFYTEMLNELSAGLYKLSGFHDQVQEKRRELLDFLDRVDSHSVTTLGTVVKKSSLKIKQSTRLVYFVAAIVFLVTIAAAIIINMIARQLDFSANEAESARKLLTEKVASLDEEMIRRAEAEREIYEFNSNLESVVHKRTSELALANKELESFVDSMSQNLRTPLRGIAGFSNILEKEYGENIPPQGQGYLKRIIDACRDMSLTIDATLNLNRYSKKMPQEEEIDLTEIATSVVDELKRNAPDRKMKIRISSGLITEADPSLARVVLECLFDNAWKFTKQKEHGEIEFSSIKQKSGTVFYLKDNGIGFDNTYATNIFQPFQKLNPLKDYPGVGIGLSMVHRIILSHRGEVWGEGEEGHGAIFYFYF